MRAYLIAFTIVLAALGQAGVNSAPAAGHKKHPNAQQLQMLETRLFETEVALWRCQDWLDLPRSRVGVRPDRLPPSVAYRRWALNMWAARLRACKKILGQIQPVVARLNRGLAGSPMAGTGRELERAGRRHHVSPFFIAAIAATESTLGEAACSNNRYNAFGLSSCGYGWHVPSFRSWAEAYEFMGRFLASRWPNARTPYDFYGYAACSSCWGSHTAAHMARLFGVGPSTRY